MPVNPQRAGRNCMMVGCMNIATTTKLDSRGRKMLVCKPCKDKTKVSGLYRQLPKAART